MSNTKTRKRIIYLDYLRVLAIFGVLLNHISTFCNGGTAFNSSIAMFYNSLGRIGVPVFLMLTGILLLNNKLPIKDFIKRRYPRVIIPFLFWIGLFILFNLFVLNPSFVGQKAINSAVNSFFCDRWYVWLILGVYLVIPIFAAFIKGTKLEGVKYFLIIWIITSTLFTISKILDFKLYYLDLTIFTGPIGFLMLGYYLHYKEFNISPKKVVIISLLVFILFTLIKTFMAIDYLSISYSFRYYIFTEKSHLENDIISIIQVAAFFLIVKYLPMVKSGICEKITKFCNGKRMLLLTISMSQASYGIYLCHYFFTLSIRKILHIYNMSYTDMPGVIFIPLFTIFVLFASYGIMMILNKVPVINKLTGYH